MDEARIERLMKTLACTREEAIAVIEEDKRIDKMTMKELTADLTAEEKKVVKEMTKVGTQTVKTERKPREKKANTDKQELINTLLEALADKVTDTEVANAEREFTFKYQGTKYKIVLSAPRS